jgi:hypothetical protein
MILRAPPRISKGHFPGGKFAAGKGLSGVFYLNNELTAAVTNEGIKTVRQLMNVEH